MAWSSAIAKYVIYHYGARAAANHAHASILLRDSNNRTKGWLFFLGEDQVLPLANEVSPGNTVYFYKHISEFSGIADTLRNEKPITLWFETTSRVIIGTSHEPVGEEET